jgi:hypothetical protein
MSLLASAAFPTVFAQRGSKQKDVTFSPERLTVFNSVSAQTFQRSIGESFSISANNQHLGSLTLLSVTVIAPTAAVKKVTMVGRVPKPAQQTSTSFSVRFQGSGAALEQGTYTLQNDSLGAFALFIVPSRSGAASPTYTAVFNLLNTAKIL